MINTPPNNIFVVGLNKGILSKLSISFLLCLTPRITIIIQTINKATPTSQGKTISIPRLLDGI